MAPAVTGCALLLGLLNAVAAPDAPVPTPPLPAVVAVAPPAGAVELTRFVITDYVNRHWRHELVTYGVELPVSISAALDAAASAAPTPTGVFLLDDAGQPATSQWSRAADGHWQVSFFADVAPYSTRTWTLYGPVDVKSKRTPGLAAGPFVSSERLDMLEVTNGRIGIRLYGSLANAAVSGPIAGVALPDGHWIGGGHLRVPAAPTTYRAMITAVGPLFAEAVATYGFADGTSWRMTVRLLADESVILVDEAMNLGASTPGAVYEFDMQSGWSPNRMFHRGAYHNDGLHLDPLPEMAVAAPNTAAPPTAGTAVEPTRDIVTDRPLPPPVAPAVPAKPIFSLMAWPKGWMQRPLGNWLALCRDGEPTMLAIGAYDAGVWITPGVTKWDTTAPVFGAPVRVAWQLRGPARHWMIATMDRVAALERFDDRNYSPLPQQELIRFGDMPLNLVKDWQLTWNSAPAAPAPATALLPHPRLYLKTGDLERFRATHRYTDEQLQRILNQPLTEYNTDPAVSAFLATGDPRLKAKLVAFGLGQIELTANLYINQDWFPTLGSELPRHYNEVSVAIAMADVLLLDGVLTPELATRVRAQVAFLGYTQSRPEVLSPERGYSANPNMTTMTRSTLGLVACLFPDHPRARDWVRDALAEWHHEMSDWTGPNGAWLEAPHYAAAAIACDIALALAIRDTGLVQEDLALDPRLRLAATWLAKLQTPPDSRLGGARGMPALGNSYIGERTNLPAWMARIWREADPTYAAQMQWAWDQQARPASPGIGGAFPSTAGFHEIMVDPAIVPAAPDWRSEAFPGSSAVMRAHFPGDHEMYLTYIQGKLHQHYDYDEGSIVMWGLGKPLIQDFGYYGRAPLAEHSVVDDGTKRYLGAEGDIEKFVTGDFADYLAGRRQRWQRQILLVKDVDPLGPNYVVTRDTVGTGRPATWRIWVSTDHDLLGHPDDDTPTTPPANMNQEKPTRDIGVVAVPTAPNPLRLIGREGVDLALFVPASAPTTAIPLPKAPTKDAAPASESATPVVPAPPVFSSGRITRRNGASGFTSLMLTQRSVELPMKPDTPLTAVLYPVATASATPTFTGLADGRVTVIVTAAGVDYVMLSATPFTFHDDALGLAFTGRVGLVQVRATETRLSLPLGGELQLGDLTLKGDADQPAVRRVPKP